MKIKPYSLSLFFIGCFIQISIVYAQEKRITPISPEATALTKMVNNPVNFFTGIPDISIPLYEIKAGGLTLPITLQYHAGGFKINEKSTRTGLGWNLSCDLQITREINGLDDFGPTGYKNNTKVTSAPYPFYTGNEGYQQQNMYEVANGHVDAMPDKFYYKLLNKSGAFFILKNSTGTGYSFMPIPYDNIKIEFAQPNFIITDSDGTKYYFGEGSIDSGTGKEFARESQYSSGNLTAWKCVKIVNNIGREEFSFSYVNTTDKNYTKRDFIEFYSAYYYNRNSFGDYFRSDEYPLSGQTSFNGYPYFLFRVSNPKYIECNASENIPKLHVPYYDVGNDTFIDYVLDYTVYGYPTTTTPTYINSLTLQTITFRGGTVTFNGANQLTNITVKNVSGQTVKLFRFFQSVTVPINLAQAKLYNGDGFQGTLYLDSLTMGISSQSYETYKFFYNDKYCYGNHLTGHDAWKYPNSSTKEIAAWGQLNILPSVTSWETYYFSVINVDDKIDNIPLTTPGSEWSLSTDEASMMKGVLKRIVYPTGGFVDYDFEANQYPVQFLIENYSMYNPNYTSAFPQRCGGLRIRSINFYEPGSMKPSIQKYYKYGKNENGIGELMYNPKIDVSDDYYNLAPVTTSQFVAHVEWPCNNWNPQCQNRNQLTLLSIERKKMYYPASAMDYSYGNGIFVFYTDVTEYNMDMGVQSGKTVYSFYSPKDFHSGQWNYQSHIPGTMTPYIKTGVYSGLQKSISQYRFTPAGEYKLLHKTSYEYEKFEKPPYIQVAYSLFNILYMLEGGVGPDEHSLLYNADYPSPIGYNIIGYDNGEDFICGTYTLPVEKVMMTKQTEERYDSLDNVTTNETTYSYDSHFQLSSTITIKSNGNILNTVYKYPYDFGGVYSTMTTKNIITPVIEEQVSANGSRTKTTKNNYKTVTVGTDFIVPSSIEIAYTNSPLKTQVTFDEYDQYGNILQLTGKDGLPISYLWGYWGLYPVAELKGVSYSLIPASFKSNAQINVPADDASLRTILASLRSNFTGNTPQITGFTHKWLTGLSSRIDANGLITYYEYDPYGRLISVKDNAGKTIQSHTYNIPNPTSPRFLWCVNTPQFFSFIPENSGYNPTYNVILPGGQLSNYVTESANSDVINLYNDQVTRGLVESTSFPPACSSQCVKVEVSGSYSSYYQPFFSNSGVVDFLQNGSVVYSVNVPFGDINNFVNPSFPTVELYIKPGTYDISVHLNPQTAYHNGNIPLYACCDSNNNELLRFNSTEATMTFSLPTIYYIYIADVFAQTVTMLNDYTLGY